MAVAAEAELAALARERGLVLVARQARVEDLEDVTCDRVLEERAFRPVGESGGEHRANVRFIVGTTADLQAWRSGQYRAGSLILAAAGKVDHDQLVALAEQRFADLPEGTIADPAPAHFTGGISTNRQSSEQAHLTLAYPAPAIRDPDYYAARLFVDIVGGGASSRIRR